MCSFPAMGPAFTRYFLRTCTNYFAHGKPGLHGIVFHDNVFACPELVTIPIGSIAAWEKFSLPPTLFCSRSHLVAPSFSPCVES
ncbi:hypothetical protein VNO77_27423 [Canavalia gladiata]|uniref:Uncharacterized protein n=1 Tax=Canavalia gladiata TaxID=3824 RepID=A0AAN9KVR8_CANGL